MKIIVDDKIPYIKKALEKIADEAVYLPGKSFTAGDVKDADALIIRTRTNCNRELLEGSSVKFIATATIGYDHIDREYCREAGIEWRNAPGCNAASVAQYVQSSLLLLQKERGLKLKGATIGIAGAGNVGTAVQKMAEGLGMRVLLNDPPRSDREGAAGFTSLATLCEECDVITFHTPLTRDGKYPTFHLGDADFFASLKRKPVIINTSRGEVIETKALKEALADGKISEAVIDVWENEPDIDRELLERVFIGTPHIAGYAADGKANATRMSLDSLCDFFHLRKEYEIAPPAPLTPVIEACSMEEALLRIYNPQSDFERLRQFPEQFEQLRGDYPLRREASAYEIHLI